MTPDISAIAKKFARKLRSNPYENGLTVTIRLAIEEATASLRAQLEQRSLVDGKPNADAYWLVNDGEMSREHPIELLEDLPTGQVVEIRCARYLPNVYGVAVAVLETENQDADFEDYYFSSKQAAEDFIAKRAPESPLNGKEGK